jgi:hypothetical protein
MGHAITRIRSSHPDVFSSSLVAESAGIEVRMREEFRLVSSLFRVCQEEGAFGEKRASHVPGAFLNCPP